MRSIFSDTDRREFKLARCALREICALGLLPKVRLSISGAYIAAMGTKVEHFQHDRPKAEVEFE